MANTATSIYLDGSADDYIETGISFASYGGEFTLEGWFLPSQSGTREGLFGAGNTDDIQVDFRTNNNLIFFARQSDGTTYACNLTISAADIAPRQAWQHLAFCRIGDRGAVFHNGVLMHNHVEILGTTENVGPPKNISHGDGPIALQNHCCSQISFRNIWVRELN